MGSTTTKSKSEILEKIRFLKEQLQKEEEELSIAEEREYKEALDIFLERFKLKTAEDIAALQSALEGFEGVTNRRPMEGRQPVKGGFTAGKGLDVDNDIRWDTGSPVKSSTEASVSGGSVADGFDSEDPLSGTFGYVTKIGEGHEGGSGSGYVENGMENTDAFPGPAPTEDGGLRNEPGQDTSEAVTGADDDTGLDSIIASLNKTLQDDEGTGPVPDNAAGQDYVGAENQPVPGREDGPPASGNAAQENREDDEMEFPEISEGLIADFIGYDFVIPVERDESGIDPGNVISHVSDDPVVSKYKSRPVVVEAETKLVEAVSAAVDERWVEKESVLATFFKADTVTDDSYGMAQQYVENLETAWEGHMDGLSGQKLKEFQLYPFHIRCKAALSAKSDLEASL